MFDVKERQEKDRRRKNVRWIGPLPKSILNGDKKNAELRQKAAFTPTRSMHSSLIDTED
jgi:hypothetical protein